VHCGIAARAADQREAAASSTFLQMLHQCSCLESISVLPPSVPPPLACLESESKQSTRSRRRTRVPVDMRPRRQYRAENQREGRSSVISAQNKYNKSSKRRITFTASRSANGFRPRRMIVFILAVIGLEMSAIAVVWITRSSGSRSKLSSRVKETRLYHDDVTPAGTRVVPHEGRPQMPVRPDSQ
jgi:hypothetical protein